MLFHTSSRSLLPVLGSARDRFRRASTFCNTSSSSQHPPVLAAPWTVSSVPACFSTRVLAACYQCLAAPGTVSSVPARFPTRLLAASTRQCWQHHGPFQACQHAFPHEFSQPATSAWQRQG